jgi:hypothetical protein
MFEFSLAKDRNERTDFALKGTQKTQRMSSKNLHTLQLQQLDLGQLLFRPRGGAGIYACGQ